MYDYTFFTVCLADACNNSSQHASFDDLSNTSDAPSPSIGSLPDRETGEVGRKKG